MKKVLLAAAALLPIILVLVLMQPILFPVKAPAPNSLTEEEKEEGWKLLFDGKSTAGWHNYGKEGVGPAWRVEGDALKLHVPQRAGNKAKGGGDLLTDESFQGDFEFKIDWKVSHLANSGIFLFVLEDTSIFKQIYESGLELQASDNALYEDAEEAYATKLAGDLYGIASGTQKAVNPLGEWNQLHLILQNNQLKVYLNDKLIHDLNTNSPEWKNAMKESMLSSAPVGQGNFSGGIGLQDWGSQVWYRNIKIRPL